SKPLACGRPACPRGVREQPVATRQDQTYAPGRVAERASLEFRCFHGNPPWAREPRRDSRAKGVAVQSPKHPGSAKGSPHGSSRVANEAGEGRQAARVGHAKSGGESTPTSL